jgi:hypothetical protein
VKHANGKLQSLYKINASDEYRKVIQRCLDVPDNGAHQNIFGSSYTKPWTDNLNEHYVETLAQEIARLIQPIKAHGSSIENMAVSIPTSYSNFLAVQVREAMSRLGLPLTEPYDLGPRDFMAISAYESGFCSFGSITPPEHCGPHLRGRRNERYPKQFILVVECDYAVLRVSSVLVFEGATLFPVNSAAFQLGTGIGDREGSDWAEVTKWLTTRVGAHRSMPDRPKFNKLVLVGSRVADEGFEKALWDALRMETDVVDLEELEAGESEVPDPEFVAAMGAAQIAKDWRDAPKPIGCQEGDECKALRKETLSELLVMRNGNKERKDEL